MRRLRTHPGKCLDLFNVVLENRGLLPLVKSVKLWNIVDLDIVLNSIAKADDKLLAKFIVSDLQLLHSVTGRAVSIVFASDEVITVVKLQLLLQWKIVELSAKSKLPVYLFLTDVEVLHVEEAWGNLSRGDSFGCNRSNTGTLTDFGDSILKLLNKLLLAARRIELA